MGYPRPTPAELVAAVRYDRLVGRGSCSAVDECFTDDELAAKLAECGVTNRDGAVRWARRYHRYDVAAYNEVRQA